MTSSMDHLEESSDSFEEVKAPMTAIGGDVGAAMDPDGVVEEDVEEEAPGVVVVIVDDEVVAKGCGIIVAEGVVGAPVIC